MPKDPSAMRETMEIFESVYRMQHQLNNDLSKVERRQKIFKKRLAKETQQHQHVVMDHLLMNNSLEEMRKILLATSLHPDDQVQTSEESQGYHHQKSIHSGRSRPSYLIPKTPNDLRIKEDLRCFYTPPDATAEVICEVCNSFRSKSHVHALPYPWDEYSCDEPNAPCKNYYFNPETKKIRWEPPKESHPFSIYVFQHTNSVWSVCHCLPSYEKRRRILQKIKVYAKKVTKEEKEMRHNEFKNTFHQLALSFIVGRR
jgi:hypothetical protein